MNEVFVNELFFDNLSVLILLLFLTFKACFN